MKKIATLTSLCLTFTILLLCLTACSTIGGKYTLPSDDGEEPIITLHFTHGGKIHVYEGAYGMFKDPIDTIYYKIDGDTIYTWTQHTREENAKGTPFSRGKDEVGSYIELGKVTYYRA